MSRIFKRRNIKVTLLNNYNGDSDKSDDLMMFYRCKCGKKQVWSSIEISECDGCYRCKTTLVSRSELHKHIIPHDFITKYDENTGIAYKICQRCNKRSHEIIKDMKAIINEKITGKIKVKAIEVIKKLFIKD